MSWRRKNQHAFRTVANSDADGRIRNGSGFLSRDIGRLSAEALFQERKRGAPVTLLIGTAAGKRNANSGRSCQCEASISKETAMAI